MLGIAIWRNTLG